MSKLDEITSRFGKAHTQASTASSAKDASREELIKAFNEQVKDRLAQRTVIIDRKHDPEEYIQTYYPGYRVKEHKGTRSGKKLYLIEEDPAYKRYTHVNQQDGLVYQRTVAEGAPYLDDERLREEEPELWEDISAWPEPWHLIILSLVREAKGICCEELKEEVTKIFNWHQIQRILKPINELTPEQLAHLQKYMVPGQLQVRIEKPRKAKPEELEE